MLHMTWPYFPRHPLEDFHLRAEAPTRRYYLTDYEPVISLPGSLRKADLM